MYTILYLSLITDLPCIVSGDTFAVLDPHKININCKDEDGVPLTGTEMSVTELCSSSSLLSCYNGLFKFEVPLDDDNYPGTIFRFPLRTPHANSKLSETAYSSKKVIQNLFYSMKEEATRLLLFLKNITSIGLYSYNQVSGKPKLLLDISIDSSRIPQVQMERKRCIELAREWQARQNTVICIYSLVVNVIDAFNGIPFTTKSFHLVLNSIGTSDEEINAKAEQLKVIPWVGIAAPCSFPCVVENCEISVCGNEINMENVLASLSRIDWQYIDPVGSGYAFCFLPLPNPTGLPVSINGYFSIADNRRSIKWPTHDEHGKGADFNKELVMKMVSYAYAVMITCRCQLISYVNTPSYLSTQLSDAYSIWPLMSQVKNHPIWSCLVDPVVKLLIGQKIVWTAAGGGKWVKFSDAYYQPEDLSIPNAVVDLLLEIGKAYIVLPNVVLDSISIVGDITAMIKKQRVTPALLRKIMKELVFIPSTMLSQAKCGEIISYILLDYDFNENFDGKCLIGINIIPLINKDVKPKQISEEKDGKMLYLLPKAEEKCLSFLAGIDDRIISTSLPSDVFHKLEKLTKEFKFNITVVDENIICQQLLPLALRKWQPASSEVFWYPSEGNNPPLSWIFNLWKWLANNNVNLNLVKDYPIIPQECLHSDHDVVVKPLCLLSQSKFFSLCFTQDDGTSAVEKTVANLLKTLGLRIIVKSPGVFQNSGIYDKFYKLTPANVIKLLALNKHALSISNTCQWAADDKKVFFKFLSNVTESSSLSSDEVNLFRELPLFRKGVNKEDYGVQLTCSEFIVHQQQFDNESVAYPSDNIVYCTAEEIKFLTALRCTQLKFHDYCIQHFIPFSQKQSLPQQRKNYSWLLSCESLWHNCDKLATHLCQLPFIATAQSHKMVRPNELYDPEDPAILRLFDDCEDELPASEFRQFLPQLRKLGLMTWKVIRGNVKIYEQLLLNRAHSVLNVLHTTGEQLALQRSCEVVTYLVEYFSSYDIKQDIKSVKFLFCSCKPMLGYPSKLQWAGQDKSGEVCSPDELYPCKTDFLVGGVGKTLSDKYSSLIIHCERFQTLLRHPDMENVINQLNLLSAVDKPEAKFSSCVHAIYEYFSKYPVEFEKYHNKLNPNWIWIDSQNSFEDACKFAMNAFCGLRLEPFCYAIVQVHELLKYEKLFLIYNIPKEFPEDIIINVMSQIKESGKHLNEEYLNIVLSILDWVHKLNEKSGRIPVEILIPTEDYQLLSPENCIFDDRGWSQNQHKKKSIDNYSFTHQRLPLITATFFGVRLLSKHLLPSINLKLQCIGPHQSITGRIKEALEDYDHDVDVLKEMVQNAEDAGASKIKFVIDWRNHPTEYLLTTEMEAWQGPALLVYNNAVFSDEDFINICEIAGASKKIDPTKIGRFGVGFCSVYHITDVPSFVSRNFYTVFDPNVSYLGKRIDPSNPGVKIDFVNSETENLEEFKDQFIPFNGLFDCNILHGKNFNATLFRFPFRTGQTASKSKISDEAYGDERVNNIVKKFCDEAKKTLTFLNNLKSISLFKIESGSQKDMKMMLHVEKHVPSETDSLVKLFNKSSQNTVYHTQRNFTIKSNDSDHEDHWMVTSYLGTDKCFEIACSSEGTQKGLCPLGEIAVKFDPKLISPYKSEGSLFCFMPVPIKSNFSFLINGYFDISRDRRSLKKDDVGNLTKWNTALIQDAIAKCFLQMLANITVTLQGNIDDCIKAYYSLWPVETDKEGSNYNAILYNSIKALLKETDFELLWSDGKWICPKIAKVYTSGLPLLLPKDCTQEIFSLLLKYGYPMVDIPKHVQAMLSLSTVSYKMFCVDVLFNNLEEIDVITRDNQMVQLLKCSIEKNDWVENLLMNNQCISTRPKGILKMPKDLIDPTSDLAELYSLEDECFPHEKFCEQTVLDALRSCGMAYSRLSNEQLKERATTIASLPNGQAYDRSLKLVKYLTAHCYNTPVAEELADVPFLPVLKCPDAVSIPWLNARTLFEAPSKLYSSKFQALIFSQVPLYDPAANDVSVLKILKLDDKHPSVSQVVEHFKCLIQCWCESDKNHTDTTNKFIGESCKEIYELLQSACYNPNYNDELKDLLKQLSTLPFVWHNNQFLSTDSVVLEWDNATYLDYLCELSQDMVNKRFQFLFHHHLGINVSPTLLQCKCVLKRLHDEQNGAPLPLKGINFCCGIANYIVSEFLKESKDGDMPQQYLPDESCVMRQIACLAYKESGVKDSSLTNSELLQSHFAEGTYWLHKNFSGHVARRLGIPSALDSILDKISDDSFFNDSEYGQHEDLCDRINSLLDKYPNDATMFKEFIQNAEDAGASEIAFILDQRGFQATDGELFSNSENWSKLHKSPSLLIYNNKTMTEDDLIGITKLGRGNKRDSLESIGRFGVGFNVAYHITDCPMFVSYGPGGVPENLCVLDPTCKYAPRATKRAPGQRWKLKDKPNYVEQFYKQLLPFLDKKLFQDLQNLSEKCMDGLNRCANGCVVFRLPLTKSSSLSSKLLPESTMTTDRLRNLLENLAKDARIIPLFIKNLKCISAFEISEKGQCSHFFTTTVYTDRRSTKDKEIFSDKVKSELNKFSAHESVDVKNFATSYLKSVQTTVVDECKKDKIKTEDEWLIAEQFGSPKMPKEILEAGIVAGLTPLGGVAIQVNCPTTVLSEDHNIFCSLPLPLKSYLPLHVNGHFWVDDSRKHLETGADNSVLSKWNESLTTTVISSAYLAGIEEYHDYIDYRKIEDTKRYYSLFPRDCSNEHSNLHSFGITKHVYEYIMIKSEKVLQKKQLTDCANKEPVEWMPMNHQVHFLSIIYKPNTDENSNKLCDLLLKFQLDLTNAPIDIYWLVKKYYTSSCPDLITPEYLLNFLKSTDNIKQIENLIKDNIQLLLTYCLQVTKEFDYNRMTTPINQAKILDGNINDDGEIKKLKEREQNDINRITELLTGVPLLLTTDGCLRRFNPEHPVYHHCYAGFFPDREEDFVDHKLEECDLDVLKKCKFLLHVGIGYLAKYSLVPDNVEPVPSSDNINVAVHNFWKCLSVIESRSPLSSQRILLSFKNKPIILGNDNYLYPPSKAKMLVHAVSDSPACNILIKLGYPTLNTEDEVAQTCISLFISLVASPNIGDNILQCIQLHQKRFEGFDPSCFLDLQEDLHRFVNTISGSSLVDETIELVCKLPIFKTFDGKYEAIRSHKQCILLPYDYENVPTSGFCKIVCELDKQILIPEGVYVELYKCLHFKSYSISNLYVQFIFKHMTLMDSSDIVEHMEFLRKESCITEGSALSLSLQDVPFLEGKTASEYFDPTVEVFSTFLAEDCFPPSPWNNYTWLPILRIIGLQTTVRGEKLIEFAYQAERLKDTEKVKILLEAIAKKIYDSCESYTLSHLNFFTELVSINFIPTFIGRDLQHLLQLFTKDNIDRYFERKFVSFRDAILPKHEGGNYYRLCFASTSDSVIDWLVDALPYGRYLQNLIIKTLQISVWPSCSTVVSNLLSLSNLIASSPQSDFDQRSDYVDKLEKLFMDHYYFLEKRSHRNDIQPLKKETFIFIRKESEATFLMVPSSKMIKFIGNRQDFSPFLFRVPKNFSQYVNLIDYLDICDEPTSMHFANILKEIYFQFHYSNGLLKNSLLCLSQAETAYYELLRLLRQDSKLCDQQVHYLLGEDNELYDQDKLVYNDAPWYSERIKDGFKCNFIKQPSPDAKRKFTLPSCLKVPHLSSLLTEEIQQSVLSEDNECLEERLARQENAAGCKHLKTLNYIIKSEQFKIGLKRVVFHETNDPPTQTDESIINTLDDLEFKCYCKIRTVLRNIKTNEIILGSEKDVLCTICNRKNATHIQDSKVEMLVVCHALNPDDVVNAISQKLNNYLNNMVRDGLYIVEMIKSCSLEDIEKKLDQLHVQPYHEGICSSKIVVGSTLKGTPDPSDQVVFVNFSPGEMIVYCNADGDRILARIKSLNTKENSNVHIKAVTIITDDDDDDDENCIETTIWCISKLLNPSQVKGLNLCGDHTKQITTGNLLLYSIPHKSVNKAISWICGMLEYCNGLSQRQKCFVLKRLKFYTLYYLMVCNKDQPAYQAILNILDKPRHDIDMSSQNDSNSVQRSHRQIYAQQMMGTGGFDFINAFSQPQTISYHRSHGTSGVYRGSSGGFYLNLPQVPTGPWTVPAKVETRPQINLQEARIWYYQASADFQACERLIYEKSPKNPSKFLCQQPALLCYLSHEVVEKCLKALCFTTCGLNKDIKDTENLVFLYKQLSKLLKDNSLEEYVHQVSEYDRSTQFPDAHVPPEPPCCVYDEIEAYNAFNAAEKVVKYVKDKLCDDQGLCEPPLAWSKALRKGQFPLVTKIFMPFVYKCSHILVNDRATCFLAILKMVAI